MISIECYRMHLETLNLINQNFPLPKENKGQLAALIKDPIDITGQFNKMLAAEYYQVFENTINTIEKYPTVQQEYGIDKSIVFDKEKTLQI